MSLAQPLSYQVGSALMQPASPIVFVVDDDVSVRESLELLIQNEGWHPKSFASAQGFLDCPRALVPNCLLLEWERQRSKMDQIGPKLVFANSLQVLEKECRGRR